jgi:NADH-ubiquinone oxidoreductase chain 5
MYSLEYMGHDPHKSRFFSLLSLFAVTMLILVTGNNLLIILLGWEGVGIVSYLLINFWFTRNAANMASMSALFLNKIGDMFFIIALILTKAIFADLSLSTIYSITAYINGNLLFFLTICLVLAASAKSALIGFTPWLAKAMEGPTSVSALLHSSTMVTAGVYLLKRISPLLELSATSLKIVLWLGSLGALYGAKCGLVDNDIKRIIAFSTKSQLGYKVVAAGISQYSIALFHLLLHAAFKSLLFLSSGAILHALLDNQNITRMGSLNLLLPYTYLVFFFASLSLMAFPFTSGFYSKDLLLELLCVPHHFSHTIAYLFTLLAAFITSSYSVRVLMIAMFSRPLFSKSLLLFVVDSPLLMTLPLIILSVGAVMLGFLSHELFLSYGSTFYMNSIFTHPHSNTFLFDASFGASTLALIPVLFLTIILLIIYISPAEGHTLSEASFNLDISRPISTNPNPNTSIVWKGKNLIVEAWAEISKDTQDIQEEALNLSANSSQGGSVHCETPFYTSLNANSIPSISTPAQLSATICTTPNLTTHFTLLNYFNVFYHWIMFFGLKTSNYMYRNIDKGFLEYLGPTGSLQYIYYIGELITTFSTGFITHYAYFLTMYLFLSIFILIFLF